MPIPFPPISDRRRFLLATGGLGAIPLKWLKASTNPLKEKKPHHEAKAKRVIYLFQSGGPSQADLFDPKPGLQFSSEAINIREPDLKITKKDDGWLVTLNKSTLPSVIIDKTYAKTVRKYIELLEGLYLTRTLHPWAKNVGKRLVVLFNLLKMKNQLFQEF